MVNGLKLPRDQMIFSVDELKKAGYSHYKINQLVEDGTLLKLNKKYYENTEYNGEESDFYYVQAYAPKGVVCLMSAASYYNLTTFRPDSVDVAIQAKISTMPDWPVLSVYYYADDRFKTGIETVQEGRNHFKIYDVEKTNNVPISKQDITTGEEIEGAKLELLDSKNMIWFRIRNCLN